jgi:hypothetical protein
MKIPVKLWYWFAACFIWTGLTTVIMLRQATHFYCVDHTKKFSIFELMWPGNRSSMGILIQQINRLPKAEYAESMNALKGQLTVDFFYMPAVYGCVFLLLIAAAIRSRGWLSDFLKIWAWLQIVAWLSDITENCYIFYKIAHPFICTPFVFFCYRIVEILKWGLSCGGFVAAVLVLVLSLFLKPEPI